MKAHNRPVTVAAVLAAAIFAWTLTAGAAEKAAPASGKSAAKSVSPLPSPTPTPMVEIPVSKFQIPASPREGRNPFFPQSMTEAAPVAKPMAKGPDASAIVLNGITSPPRSMAMLNGKTFEPGESGEVKLPSGDRVPVQCIEIRKDSVLIQVGNERRELRLRGGL